MAGTAPEAAAWDQWMVDVAMSHTVPAIAAGLLPQSAPGLAQTLNYPLVARRVNALARVRALRHMENPRLTRHARVPPRAGAPRCGATPVRTPSRRRASLPGPHPHRECP